MGGALLCNKESKKEIRINNSFLKNDFPIIKKEDLELNILLKIIEQMKTSVCQIAKTKFSGTGFFCSVPFPDESNKLRLLITSYSVLGKDELIPGKYIKLVFYDNSFKIIKINKNRKIYISNELKHNITIIELNKNDEIDNNMMQIDNALYNNKYYEYIYKNKSIYTIFFSQNKEVKYDINIITNVDSYNSKMTHLCLIEDGAIGAPILNLENYSLIGVNIGHNLGTLIKDPINEFLQSKQIIYNEIILTLAINKDDIGQNIYFLDNTNFKDYEKNRYHYHDNLKELNDDNTTIFINDEKYEFTKCFRPIKEGIYSIRVKFNIHLTDCSYMFYYCYSLINIDLTFFDSSKVTNMSYMFAFCINLMSLDLICLDTGNVTNMNYMFYFCQNLKNLDLSYFNTQNVLNMSRMFSDCINLKEIDLENFNTQNVKTMSHMFFLCKSLIDLDLSFFDTKNVLDMSNMFYFCKSLRKLDLSTFNTKNVFDMSKMFYLCNNLLILNLSSFDTSRVINMSYMFSDCKNLVTLDLSSFDTRNVIDMSHFLSGTDMTKIKLSNFNTINVIDMSFMFYFCKKLKYIDISSFNTKNVKNMSYMFSDCRYLRKIDLSSFTLNNIKEMKFMFTGCVKNLKIKVNENAITKFQKENEHNFFYI